MNKLEKFIEECGSHEIEDCSICNFAFGERNCLGIKCQSYNELYDELSKPYKKQIKFTEDERAILRNLPIKYKWVARDNNGGLFVYINKPYKNKNSWHDSAECSMWLVMYMHLFQQIQWSDKEPINFREVLENE